MTTDAPTRRTDVHRPTTLVTEHYEFVGAYDAEGSYGNAATIARRQQLRDLLRSAGDGAHSRHGDGQCDHCGAHIRYRAVLRYRPTSKYIEVGETCLDNRFGRATAEFQALRAAAQLDREQQRIKRGVLAFVSANQDLAWMADKETPAKYARNDFLVDIARKLRLYGELSFRQIIAARNAMRREDAFAAHRQERASQPSTPAAPVPTGRMLLKGEVLRVKEAYPFDRFPSVKLLIRDDRGFRVWGTAAKALGILKSGDRVQFSAEVMPSKDDPSFGFYSRPTDARRV